MSCQMQGTFLHNIWSICNNCTAYTWVMIVSRISTHSKGTLAWKLKFNSYTSNHTHTVCKIIHWLLLLGVSCCHFGCWCGCCHCRSSYQCGIRARVYKFNTSNVSLTRCEFVKTANQMTLKHTHTQALKLHTNEYSRLFQVIAQRSWPNFTPLIPIKLCLWCTIIASERATIQTTAAMTTSATI